MRRAHTVSAALCGALAFAVTALATPAAHAANEPGDLAGMSLEDLMELEVTSVSKRSQRLFETPAAVTVLTGEDIRRSGATNVPDALRMVPGLHVASIDSSSWAITSRGFNGQFANKLLVMIDGRSAYTPLFSGTYWDAQDVMLEDVERIEVVRGPGASVWGANAVNGVINIITKQARDTQGLLISSLAGNVEQAAASGRWGGSIGADADYRGYVRYTDRAEFDDGPLGEANDAWDVIRGGFRVDWEVTAADSLTLQGDYYDGGAGQTLVDLSKADSAWKGGNVLLRWTHDFTEQADLSLQLYYDRTDRFGETLDETRDTFDVDFQHSFRPFERHRVIWGAGYRFTADDTDSSTLVTLDPESRTDHLGSAFLQDEITLVRDRLRLIVGAKFEHNDYTGFEYQPTGRLLWTPHSEHTVWGAVSRAVRSPSRAESDVALFLPAGPTSFSLLQGNEDFRSEDVLAYELGYRSRPAETVSMDLAAYVNVYSDLRSIEPGVPIANFPFFGATTFPASAGNEYDGLGYGVEVSGDWEVLPFWRLSAAYTFMKLDLEADANSLDPATAGQEDDTPANQFNLRSRTDLPGNVELDTTLFYVGRVKNQDVDDYVRLDIRLGWQPREGVDLSLVGQNLTERSHEEFGPQFTQLPTSVPRGVYGKVAWRY